MKEHAKDQDKFVLRLPEGMREEIREAAEENGRSMNAEIVFRLQTTFDPDHESSELRKARQNLEASQGMTDSLLRNSAEIQRGILYILLDADGHPISWDEIMTHLQAISDAAGGPFDRIEANIVDPARASSDERLDYWLRLRDYYRQKLEGKKR